MADYVRGLVRSIAQLFEFGNNREDGPGADDAPAMLVGVRHALGDTGYRVEQAEIDLLRLERISQDVALMLDDAQTDNTRAELDVLAADWDVCVDDLCTGYRPRFVMGMGGGAA